MKKLYAGCFALLASGMALGQSSLTLSGLVDATVSYGKGSGAGAASKTQLTSNGNGASRLVFRGVEDLGGGLSASFWLEAGMTPDDGQGAATNSNNQPPGTGAAVAGRQGLTLNRRSTVSLAGRWGEVRAGRDYTATYSNSVTFDPFNNLGVGTSQILNSTIGGPGWIRVSNSIAYWLPADLGGFYGTVQHYLGENASGNATSDDGAGTAARIGYSFGALNAAAAVGRTFFASGDIATSTIGASYQFAPVKLSTQFYRDEVDRGATGKGWLVGAVVPVGSNEIRTSYSTYVTSAVGRPQTRKLALGYVVNLSKRTAFYATAAKLNNRGGATQALAGAVTALDGSSVGYQVGLRHLF